MILVIRLLRLLAVLTGITGAMIKVRSVEPRWQAFGIALAVLGCCMLIAAYVLTSIAAARQKFTRHRR